MAHDERDGRGSHNGTLDAKSLLYGACSLIVLLAGVVWGLWNSNHSSEIEDTQRANAVQWERLRQLNDLSIEHKTILERLRRDLDDQETRLRALEHRGDKTP